MVRASAARDNNRASLLQDLRRLEEALAGCDRAIALNPRYGIAHSNRGNILKALNRPDEALSSYDRAIALDPGNASAYWNKALLKLLTIRD